MTRPAQPEQTHDDGRHTSVDGPLVPLVAAS